MTSNSTADQVERLQTGIPGLDEVAEGGLPLGRSTLLIGTAGAGKTVLASQLLAAGIDKFGEAGVLVTFDETPESVLRNASSFGWDFERQFGNPVVCESTCRAVIRSSRGSPSRKREDV